MSRMTAAKPADLSAALSMIDAMTLPAADAIIDTREDELIAFRRALHRQPEASGQELLTTAAVADMLVKAGLKPQILSHDVGVMCDIDVGAASGQFIAIRAELDSVRVNDDKRVSYASTCKGQCHACGHDVHTTMALGAFIAMAQQSEALRSMGLRHNLRVVFQPAEETADGARSMIEQGVTRHVAAMIALHVEPFMDIGTVGLRVGPLTSACKSFEIHVRGRSGHSARPHQALDPIPAAVSLTDLFYQLGPRSMDSRYPLSLTVASINAGHAFNAIPDHAVIRGTLRTSRIEDLDAVERRMWNVIQGVQLATGCAISMTFPQYAPATNNDAEVIAIIKTSADDLLGEQAAHWIEVPSMGGEDFAFFQEVVPGAIVRIGAAMPDPAQRKPLHSSLFDIDERAIAIGAKLLVRSALLAAATFDR